MTTINSWEVLTNDGWQHNFYGTTAHQFTYRTNDQQRKREESAETELGLHSNAITIMSFSISDVKNIFTGNSISFSQVHQSWATQISRLFFFCPQHFSFFCEWIVKGGRWGMLRILWVACPSLHHIYSLSFSYFFLFFFLLPSDTSRVHCTKQVRHFQNRKKAFFSFHQKGSLCKQ